MISVLLIVRLTIVLAAGAAAFAVFRRIPAATKHLLCTLTLLIALFLPLTPELSWVTPLHTSRFIVNASSSFAAASSIRSVHWLLLIWSLGASGILLRFIIGVVYLRWRTRESSEIVNESLPDDIHVLAASVSTPAISGWIRPIVLVPRDFREWSYERRRFTIFHEKAHLQRFDNWVLLIALFARALYWFHPLVWWLAARLEEQQELACDDLVLAGGADPVGYADLLVDVARRFSTPILLPCAMVPNKGHLRGRVKHILAFKSSRFSRTWNRFALVLGAACIVAAGILLPAKAGAVINNQRNIYKIGGDVLAPKIIHKIEPQYSERARRAKISGIVLLDIVVDTDGIAKNIRVDRSLDKDLDRNAVKAVSNWRFLPATKDGESVPVEAKVEIHYRLK